MLSFAVIVFREVLEVMLVLGLVFASTAGVLGRWRWISLGIFLGIFGSFLLAAGTERLSQFAEGMGQELFHACVLLCAASLIGFTVIWMKRHGARIAKEVKVLGQEIANGDRHLSFLSILIGLTVLREGSEVVLLSQGFLASGNSFATLAAGAGIGLIGGASVGLGLYAGLVKVCPRAIFRVCTVLMSLVAAGMFAQGLGLLSAADFIHPIIEPLWDTSWLISESSTFGHALHMLIGYISRPSALQVIAYLAVLLGIWAGLRLWGGSAQKSRSSAQAAA